MKTALKRFVSLLMVLMMVMSNVGTAFSDALDENETTTAPVGFGGVNYLDDSPETNPTSTNLNDFVGSFTLTDSKGNVIDWSNDGTATLDQAETYKVKLVFDEKQTGTQFASTGLVYTFPDGFTATPVSASGVLQFGGKDVASYEVKDNKIYITPYYSSDNGNTFHADKADGDKSFVDLFKNAEMTIWYTGKFTSSSDGKTFDFGDGAKVTVELENSDNDAKVTVNKSISDSSKLAEGKLTYDVELKVAGKDLTKVTVTDTLKDTYTTYDTNSLVVKDSSGNVIDSSKYTVVWNGSSFTLTMTDTELLNQATPPAENVFHIVYDGNVDTSILSSTTSVKVGENGVTAKLTGNNEPEITSPESHDYETIESTLKKVATGTSYNSGVATQTWKITVGNGYTNVSDQTVNDTWTTSGTGLTGDPALSGTVNVTLTGSDGKTYQINNKAYSDVFTAQDNGFKVDVAKLADLAGMPEDVDVTKAEITYTTTVAYDTAGANGKVNNTATTSGGSETATGGVTAQAPTVNPTKEITALDPNFQNATYKVTIPVDKYYNGVTGFYVIDRAQFVGNTGTGYAIALNPTDITAQLVVDGTTTDVPYVVFSDIQIGT